MKVNTIRIFLIEGSPSGPRTAEIGVSTVKSLVLPRASLYSETINTRQELVRTGVYILIGQDTESTSTMKDAIYVGEGDSVIKRIAAHDKDKKKDFWEDAIVFVSKDENLTKSHVRYLEAQLIALAKEGKRCRVCNSTSPTGDSMLPESEAADMNVFLSQVQILMRVLGYDVFEPQQLNQKTSQPIEVATTENVLFEFKGTGFKATCRVDVENGRYIVHSGSTAKKKETKTMPKGYSNLRSALIESGILVMDSKGLCFKKDHDFKSASAAAAVVAGRNISGNIAWKCVKSDVALGKWREKQPVPEPSE